MCLESAARIPQFCISRSQYCLLALPYQYPFAVSSFLHSSYLYCHVLSHLILDAHLFLLFALPQLLILTISPLLSGFLDVSEAAELGVGKKKRDRENVCECTHVSAGCSFMIYGAGFWRTVYVDVIRFLHWLLSCCFFGFCLSKFGFLKS